MACFKSITRPVACARLIQLVRCILDMGEIPTHDHAYHTVLLKKYMAHMLVPDETSMAADRGVSVTIPYHNCHSFHEAWQVASHRIADHRVGRLFGGLYVSFVRRWDRVSRCV